MTSPMMPELPEHCPISVTEDGRGPAVGDEAFMTVCWCGDPGCMLFYGSDHDPVTGYPLTAQFDADGSFQGHRPRACRDHRTVGEHRAWCFDCSEWCYPSDGCIRCRHPDG